MDRARRRHPRRRRAPRGLADLEAEPARSAEQRSPYFWPLAPLFFLGFLTSLRRMLLPFPIGVSFAFQERPVNSAIL